MDEAHTTDGSRTFSSLKYTDPSGFALHCQPAGGTVFYTYEQTYYEAPNGSRIPITTSLINTFTVGDKFCWEDGMPTIPRIPVASPYNISASAHRGAAPPKSPSKNSSLFFEIFCSESGEDAMTKFGDTTADVGVAADYSRPLIGIAGIAAGMTKGMEGGGILAGELATFAETLGTTGKFSAAVTAGWSFFRGNLGNAIYAGIDYRAYSYLTEAGAAGALETGGESVALAATAGGVYYMHGGSKGIIQGLFCPRPD